MAPLQPNKYARTAEEGFSMIDNGYYGGGGGGYAYSSSSAHRRSSTSHHSAHYNTYQPMEQYPSLYYCPKASTMTVNFPAANEGIRYYRGSRPAAREEEIVMTSDEAAQRFGGFVVVDHGSRRRSSKLAF